VVAVVVNPEPNPVHAAAQRVCGTVESGGFTVALGVAGQAGKALQGFRCHRVSVDPQGDGERLVGIALGLSGFALGDGHASPHNECDCLVDALRHCDGFVSVASDVYLLKDVLHDWEDEHCRKILSTVAAAMPSGSRVLLVKILQQSNTPNPFAPSADLLMLTQTDGGRQR
jgi:O-methyltransferase domain